MLSSRFSFWLPLVWNVPMATTFLRIFGTVLLSCPFLSLHNQRIRARRGLRLCLINPPLSISTWAGMKYLPKITWRVWMGSRLEPRFPTSQYVSFPASHMLCPPVGAISVSFSLSGSPYGERGFVCLCSSSHFHSTSGLYQGHKWQRNLKQFLIILLKKCWCAYMDVLS